MEASGRINPPAWTAAPDTRIVMEALAADGATARFVGGCVRDAILGWPVTDIDIATSETPEAATALLQKAGIRVVPTGIAHGTVTAVVGSAHFEITTLRRDVETFGRHARVAFTDDWVADAERRDFTINAMFCDADGTLYDPTGGFDDLHAGRVRFVGDPERRIGEDVLRLLRFFRFYAHYGRSPPDAAALAARIKALPVPLTGPHTLDEAISINERSHRFDGIETIEEDGSVVFTEHSAAVMRDALGYEGKRLRPAEAADRADELSRRFNEYARQHGVDLGRRW